MKIYMIGIGGIGISALAQLYTAHGETVTGSDREAGPTTALLEKKGITVIIGQRAENVPADAEVVVYSDALPYDAPERVRARELGIPEHSYFQALGEVSQGTTTIAVAGTHGKTTTTAMLTKILKEAGKNPTAIIGSIVKDFGSNFVEGSPDLFIVEACEYKDHVLEIEPKILVITNVEWDHTDYFVTLDDMLRTFNEAVCMVPAGGAIVTNPALPHMDVVLRGAVAPIIDYTKEVVPALNLIGDFNVQNAKAAKAAALVLASDLTDVHIDASLTSFVGTWRRFEYKGKTALGALVYDDYAHHPTAVQATIAGVREKFPGKNIVIAFHPHLYSRTKDLFNEFVSALATADQVFLAPIYAAREVDDGTVSSERLAEAISKTNPNVVALSDFDAIRDALQKVESDSIILTMGAGDIYKVAEKIIV